MILPIHRETFVLSISADELYQRLQNSVRKGRRTINSEEEDKPFMGLVAPDHFNITRLLKRPENFMPQIEGTVESTSSGSILFLKYTLQFSSSMFVIFWSVTTIMFAIFLWFIHFNLMLGLGSILALVLNLIITHVNFRRQLKVSRELFMEELGIN